MILFSINMDYVRFDGKHWIAKRPRNGPFLFHSYEYVAEQANQALGKNGIVAIPNARPDEYRYEEFINSASGIKEIEDGRAIYDSGHEVYFMKAQKINTNFNNIPITFLAYNLPFEKNIDDKTIFRALEESHKNNYILGITLPSCIRNLEQVLESYPSLLNHLDFVVGYSGIAALKKTNIPSLGFYQQKIKGKTFDNSYSKEHHKIGIIAVSGGHRTPKTLLGRLFNGFNQTIGSSYTRIPEPSDNNFMADLRKSLQQTNEADHYLEKIFAEALRHKFSIDVWDKTGLPHFK